MFGAHAGNRRRVAPNLSSAGSPCRARCTLRVPIEPGIIAHVAGFPRTAPFRVIHMSRPQWLSRLGEVVVRVDPLGSRPRRRARSGSAHGVHHRLAVARARTPGPQMPHVLLELLRPLEVVREVAILGQPPLGFRVSLGLRLDDASRAGCRRRGNPNGAPPRPCPLLQATSKKWFPLPSVPTREPPCLSSSGVEPWGAGTRVTTTRPRPASRPLPAFRAGRDDLFDAGPGSVESCGESVAASGCPQRSSRSRCRRPRPPG